MNLGEKLQKLADDIAKKNTERQRREAEKERRKIEKEKEDVNDVFQRAWKEMREAVEDERMPKGIKIEEYGNIFRDKGTPKNPQHPYHDIYQEWVRMAENEGLTLYIVNNHDGGGMRDWEVVTFTIRGNPNG